MTMLPLPADEAERLFQLQGYGVLGAPSEPAFEAIVDAAADLFDVPIGHISIVDRTANWLTARKGIDMLQVSREHSFCTHTILKTSPLVVPDARLDPRFATNPHVLGELGVRFYAGAPIINDAGVKLGALCVVDHQPRHQVKPEDLHKLEKLAHAVAVLLDQRRDLRLKSAVDGFARSSGLALVATDADGRISFWNPAAEAMFGYSARRVLGRSITMIMPARFHLHHRRGVERIHAGVDPRLTGKVVEVVGLHRDGREFPIEMSLSTWTGPQGREFGAQIQDISVRHARDLKLRHMAKHDPLTGLLNRREFSARVESTLTEQGRATLLLLDLDQFKVINDTLGHTVGDDLLRMVALKLMAQVDCDVVLARVEGGRFKVLLPGSDDPLHALEVGEALLSAFQHDFSIAGHELRLAANVGFAVAPRHAQDAEELLVRADLALLEAKNEGGGTVRLFDRGLESRLEVQRAFTDEVLQATRERQWVLHYQPQVRMSDGQPVGAEALLRWQHPTRGLISPALFMPTLETHAIAGEVGQWVMSEACAQLVRWRAMGIELPRVSVNLFAAQLRVAGIERAVRETLAQHGLAPSDLELEITENIALRQDARALDELQSLRRAGVRLAFDDFGTGFASLTTLKDIKVDKVKVDRAFVKDLPADPHSRAITGSLVQLARELGLEIVTEGVETPEQREALLNLGCKVGQGYLWARPSAGAITFASTLGCEGKVSSLVAKRAARSRFQSCRLWSSG